MNKEKKVGIIIIIIILILFLILFFFFGGIDSFKNKKNQSIILVGNNTYWEYKDKKFYNITSNVSSLYWKDYIVYINNKKYGTYKLWHDDKWYLYDKDRNYVSYDGSFLAISSNYDIKPVAYSLDNLSSDKYVKKVLSNNNIKTNNFTVKNKVNIDIDNDSKKESIYLISNVLPIDKYENYRFSIVFMVKNDIIYTVFSDVQNESNSRGCKPYIDAFIDVDKDEDLEMIMSCGGLVTSGTKDYLYDFKDNKITILVSNQ